MKPRLILASSSPYRLQLLQAAGYQVEAIPSRIAEPDLTTFPSVKSGLMALAQWKAEAVLDEHSVRSLILAADTVSCAAGECLGKPLDREAARAMLQALSGTRHSVLTGWCLLRPRDHLVLAGVETTFITMRPWTGAEIDSYLDSGEWEGKCGGYGLQLPHDPFVTLMDGSAANVIGVPLERLSQIFSDFPSLSEVT